MEILGYSERGVINALFYDLLSSPKSKQLNLISYLLSKAIFINKKEKFNISCCQVFIEQSFSDFGDSDVLLLVENNGKKQAIFLEAKVKTYNRNKWHLDDEFNKFLSAKVKPITIPTSNLFTQLYFKNRLWYELKNNNGIKLDEGIKFINTTKSWRKIGKNKIVLKAVDYLKGYIDESFYLGIIPNTQNEIDIFIKKDFIPSQSKLKKNLTNWNNTNWGFLAWEDIHKFCKNNGLINTRNVFDFNFYKDEKNQNKSKGQIYN